ncbi:single hybrid motif-containing protein [Mycena galopus ATCC 62051]|nr:single hybrid motif-containing protein [Mycena galopus ATCC 62051]
MQSILRQACSSRSAALLRPQLARPRVFRSAPQLARTLHELVQFDDATGLGVIHITDHAQSSLGDVVFVAQGDQIGAVESVKAASDIYAPVSGTIEEVNDALGEQPNLLNKSPEDRIRLAEPAEMDMDKLLTEEAYKKTWEEHA